MGYVSMRCSIITGTTCSRARGLLTIFFFLASIIIIPHVEAQIEEDTIWENISSLTEVSKVRNIEVNSAADSLLIHCGNTIREWGLLNQTNFRALSPKGSGSITMDWNSDYGWMAWAHNPEEYIEHPVVFNSQLVIFDIDVDPITALEPYGDLPSNENLTITAIEWQPNSPNLAVAFGDGVLKIYDIQGLRVIGQQNFSRPVIKIRWNPQGTTIALLLEENVQGRTHQDLFFFNIEENETWEVPWGSDDAADIAWFYNGSLLLINSGELVVYNMITSTFEFIWSGSFIGALPSPVGPTIAIIENHRVDFLDFETGELEKHYVPHQQTVNIGWTEDGTYFCSMDDIEIIRIWTRKSTIPKPEVGIDTPLDGSTVSGNVTVIGWARSVFENGLHVSVQVGPNDWVPADGYFNWTYDLDTSLLPDGALVIRTRAVDPGGSSDYFVIRVFVDNDGATSNEPPTVYLDEPTSGSVVYGIVPLRGRATDDVAIKSVQYMIEGDIWRSVPITSHDVVLDWTCHIEMWYWHDETEIHVRAFDGMLFSDIVTVEVIVDDTASPQYDMSIEILLPTEGSTVPPSFRVAGIVEGEIPDMVYLKIDSIKLLIVEGTTTWGYDFSEISNGSHHIGAIARKDSYHTPWTKVRFWVDEDIEPTNRPPVVAIVGPQPLSIVTRDFEVNGWSVDDVEVEKIELRINNGSWTDAVGTTDWTYLVGIGNLTPGWINVDVRAYDGEYYSDTNSTTFYYLDETPIPTRADDRYYSLIIILGISIIILIAYIIREKIKIRG